MYRRMSRGFKTADTRRSLLFGKGTGRGQGEPLWDLSKGAHFILLFQENSTNVWLSFLGEDWWSNPLGDKSST